MAAWAAAAKRFTDAFSDEIHINITVDAVTKPGVFGRSFPGTVTIGYADLFEQMSAHASTQNDVIAIGPGGSMTASDPTNGQGTWVLMRAQAKALGHIPDDMSDDGGTTFGVTNPFTFSGPIAPRTFDFQGVAAHEISEVMGRLGFSGQSNQFSLIDTADYLIDTGKQNGIAIRIALTPAPGRTIHPVVSGPQIHGQALAAPIPRTKARAKARAKAGTVGKKRRSPKTR